MRIRHRIPSIFTLSMVDVLCCALGCVILLWLLNLREAKEHEDSARDNASVSAARLKHAEKDRESAYQLLAEMDKRLSEVGSERDRIRDSVVELTAASKGMADRLRLANARVAALERDAIAASAQSTAIRKELTDSNKEMADRLKLALARLAASERDATAADACATAAREELAASSKEMADRLKITNTRLAASERDATAAATRAKALQVIADAVPALQGELKDARERVSTEEALARALEKDIAKKMRELTDATKTLQVMQAARQSLEREVAAKSKELDTAGGYRERWAASAGRVAELEKLVEERGKTATTAKKAVELLEEEKKALRAEASRYRQSADNRFAGIELTGKRVIFLVDMSGSMELVDETTAAPLKWSEVRRTLAKVMRSLPDLAQFQVIVFSERAAFLVGGEDQWLDYDSKTTPDQILTALAAIKPKGGTNMYAALDAAFRYRSRGLDTIYLFSDGLPNLGEGITAEQARTLKEVDQSEILGKYIRKKLRTDWNFPDRGAQRVRINAVGFFFESPDVGAFLWALARENDGSFVGMSKP
jgi:hypothetical protein